jgi:hypothetical protein
MSYSLTPVAVDVARLRSLTGSKDAALLQAVIKKYRKQMISTDGLGEDFDDFEDEIKAEYKAFAAGDFSAVDLNATYPDRPRDEDDDDEGMAALREDIGSVDTSDPAAMQKFIEKHRDTLSEFLDDEDEDGEDDDEDEEEPTRELTTGAALAHLILGGKPDPAVGYKYGYALSMLCEHIGTVPEHDSWCTIRSAAFDAVDEVLETIGVPPAEFTTHKFLVNRGSPVAIPEPDDFPYIGYLERDEIRKLLGRLDPAKVEAAIRDADEQEWLRTAIDELRSWLELCATTDRDLVCFYS